MEDNNHPNYPRDWVNPSWNLARRVHDWRNYVWQGVREIWDSFTPEQKYLIALQAQKLADNENWD